MPDRFPQQVALRDGRKVLIRPFKQSDTGRLYEFFQGLPANVRRFAWDNIEHRGLIESWGLNIDYSRVLPLIALDGNTIVADATLHCRQRGPLRLVGRIKWLMAPTYRGQGLGITLVNDLISVGKDYGLRHLTCMPIAELEEDAIETLRNLGFQAYPIPGYGADPDGEAHDMVKLVLKL